MWEVYNTKTKRIERDGFRTAADASEYIDLEDDENQVNLKVRQQTTPNERRKEKSWL